MQQTEHDQTASEEPFSLTVDQYGRLWLHTKLAGVEVALDLADKADAFDIMAEKMAECGFEHSAVVAHQQADNDDQRRPWTHGRSKLPPSDVKCEAIISTTDQELLELGWKPFFADQLSTQEHSLLQPVRVMAAHRGKLAVTGVGLDQLITPRLPNSDAEEYQVAVGDWLLVDPASFQISRILGRTSLFKRRAPGSGRALQLIASNVDTAFIVASCNQDFNLARIERYLILAREVGVQPIVVLTKQDLTDTPDRFVQAARSLQSGLEVAIIDGRDPLSAGSLAGWCGVGETVALLGSSGVGKSTLINTLRGSQAIATRDVRETDGKGRHTTTVREMHRLTHGGWLMDTPGMRELQLSDAAHGLADVFEDILALALRCKFSNCAHRSEPGCAVRSALNAGTLQADRLDRLRKLTAEDELNTLSLDKHRSKNRPTA